MNQNMNCEQARISLGVYVLGAIDPAERAMVDAHLETCQECRDELDELAGLPALLAMVSTEEALQLGEADPGPAPRAVAVADPVLPPPLAAFPAFASIAPQPQPEPSLPEPRPPVLDLSAARRRRRTGWRNGMMAAAAAVIIAIASFTGAHFLSSTPTASANGDGSNFGPGSAWETAQFTSASGQQHVWLKYRSVGWGLQIDTRVTGIPIGSTCDLYVITKSGQRLQVANWTTDKNEGTVWYSGSSAVSDADVVQFQVTTGGRTPPITSSPDDT
jgi:hypothetical protein